MSTEATKAATPEGPPQVAEGQTAPRYNGQDVPAKVVGRRRPGPPGLMQMRPLFETMIRLREGKPYIPKGVWRFKSFEEAEEWKMKMLTRKK